MEMHAVGKSKRNPARQLIVNVYDAAWGEVPVQRQNNVRSSKSGLKIATKASM